MVHLDKLPVFSVSIIVTILIFVSLMFCAKS
jgi:hypothetical protein